MMDWTILRVKCEEFVAYALPELVDETTNEK